MSTAKKQVFLAGKYGMFVLKAAPVVAYSAGLVTYASRSGEADMNYVVKHFHDEGSNSGSNTYFDISKDSLVVEYRFSRILQ